MSPTSIPSEGIWSVLKRGVLANLAVAGYAYLVQVIRQSGNLAVSGAVLAQLVSYDPPAGPCLAGL